MGQHAKILVSTIGVLTGIAILSISVPRLYAEIILLPNASIIQQIHKPQDISDDDLSMAYEAVVNAGEWHSSAELLSQQSVIEMAFAKRSQAKAERNVWFEKSELSMERSLQSAPGDPYSWMRLAYLRYVLGGKDNGVKDLLVMSMATGPYERPLALSQIEYALLMWDMLSESEQKDIQDKILWIDRFRRGELVHLAKRDKVSMGIIVSAISRDPQRLVGFLKHVFKK